MIGGSEDGFLTAGEDKEDATADSFAEVDSREVSAPWVLPGVSGDRTILRIGWAVSTDSKEVENGRSSPGSTGSVFSFRSSPNMFNNLVIITSAVLALAFGKP